MLSSLAGGFSGMRKKMPTITESAEALHQAGG
jgi:hypothetical protein